MQIGLLNKIEKNMNKPITLNTLESWEIIRALKTMYAQDDILDQVLKQQLGSLK